MGKGQDLSDIQKGQIQALLATGDYTYREIAEKTEVSKSTVDRFSKKLKSGVAFVNLKRKNCFKNRCTTDREDRLITSLVKKNRQATNRQLRMILAENNITVSKNTLCRRLKISGFKGCKPVKKPCLTS